MKFEHSHHRLPNKLGGQLSVDHYRLVDAKAAVLLLHGIGGSAAQFGDAQHGLIQFCLSQGFEVFTLDLHGHGQSWPQVSGKTRYGIHDVVESDLTLFMKHVKRRSPNLPRFLVGHGFAGMLWLAYMARHPDAQIQGLLHLGWLGSGNSLPTPGALWQRFALSVLAPTLGRLLGYVPSWVLGRGSHEALDLFMQARTWMSGRWADPVDSYPYMDSLARIQLPPSLYLTDGGERERVYTARSLMNCLGQHDSCLVVLDARYRAGLEQKPHSLQSPVFTDGLYPLLSDWFASRLPST